MPTSSLFSPLLRRVLILAPFFFRLYAYISHDYPLLQKRNLIKNLTQNLRMQENLPKSKKIRTRSDTKLNPDSAQGVMGLEITSLLENSKTDESGDSNNGMESNASPRIYILQY
ncbi:hypothetical protein GLOIN_2v1828930 [Rhizophagus irregularis DAOM 181602=DAOM 197198]|uniref:Uncharacterized protein n=1 Tax=Rhizophagus irregularis (strain DAOM 181602 / DAOM 197198 / MUCL 43194) TaxID=747089 RepID=A0A2P4Q5H5_RHIID|nr:hypothetical protein GLOIN_2v1828930 [Rhizophagus irregularis DAOM 181602=DAOM 197198]POG72838.1 hypothetical protein GLOIN_2v1828930 [Rhizophagus irregularis DAOM 181602=DAOM 197198]|eukprot:XP_025179704.1 hypothetical protein GLOIN_2v1828930 [Rhizophagus irregularis DAOM 181602=DAOM 197198]